MRELIKVTVSDKGSQIVSARELHLFLEVKTDFSDWCKRMFEYGFEAQKDYSLLKIEEPDNQVVKNPKTLIYQNRMRLNQLRNKL